MNKVGLTKDRIDALPEWQSMLEIMKQAHSEVTELAIKATTFEMKEYFHGYRDCLERIISLPEDLFKEEKGNEENVKRPPLVSWGNPIV